MTEQTVVGRIPLKRSERDSEQVRTALAQWLAPRVGAGRDLRVSELTAPGGTGVANETLMFDASWTDGGRDRVEGFAVRVASERNLYIEADIETQCNVYAALADAPGVPVPRVYGYEGDPDMLGAPFFVMERMYGDVPGDTPHWSAAGFVHDTLERGYEWLRDHLPAPAPTGLSWGDSRFPNVMFRDDRVVAIFDWDTVSMAGAEADLAWWRFMDGSSGLEGIGDSDAVVARWEELTGRTVQHLDWHEVFTSFRLGCVMLRLFAMMGEDGVVPPAVAEEQARNSGPAQALAAQLDARS